MSWYETEKKFFTKDNPTPDTECALRPPYIFGPEAFSHPCYSAKQRKWQSAPCVARGGDGLLYCCFSADNFGGDEEPNNYNVIMKSADNGKSWLPEMILDHPDSVRMHEPVLFTDASGALWHFWAQSYIWWDGRGGVWCIKADAPKKPGDALVWSAPRRLCDGVMATVPITRANGEILLPVSIWKNVRSSHLCHKIPALEKSNVYVSRDGGESFSYLGSADEKDTTFDENALVERADGSLYMIMRCEHAISASVSSDGGKTWSVPKKVMDHTSSRSFLAKFPSGHYLLVTNNDPKTRRRMTAFLSKDECESWQPCLLLDERESVSYPAGFVDTAGRVYVSYDFNRYQEEELYLASFTEKDLAAGKPVEPDSFLKRLIVKGENGSESEKVFEDGYIR